MNKSVEISRIDLSIRLPSTFIFHPYFWHIEYV